KALHDCLHFLQFQYLDLIVDAAARFRQDNGQYRQLQRYAAQLRSKVEDAEANGAGLPSQALEEGWIGDFRAAIDDIDAALDSGDGAEADARMARALILLKAILAEAPRINNALALMAGELPLKPLVGAMREVAQRLGGGPDGDSDPDSPRARLRAGLSDLLQLQPRL